ncbi:hypothetical protein F5Y12DRAFT_472510 [Xylaria sp. FL1777]|nr:hypothetical protein F5Y12DRAFT_472510 [Xylaria sp. FL1777]
MDSTHLLLPSTFSPWRSEGPGDLANNSKRSTSPDAARSSAESTVSDNAVQSLSPSDVSTSTAGRRGSAVFYSPQSLNVVPHTTTREPAAYTTSPQAALSHSQSIRSAVTAQTVSSLSPSEIEGQPSLRSTQGGSEPSILVVSNVNAMRSASIMPTHPGAESVPMSAMYNPMFSPTTLVSEDEGDAENSPRYPNSHVECHSRQDVYIQRWSWLYATLIILSLYSTVFSGIWLGASIFQPRYGRSISTGNGWQISPSTATLLATLGARTIELSFVTVFVAVLGQVLTRRALSRLSRGITLAEMTMRNWVIQPGSLLTHWSGIPYAASTFLGVLSLIATVCALFYTTASDAMVSPKLWYQAWEMRDMQGLVKTSYANPYYVLDTCQNPLNDIDPDYAPWNCLDILFSGQSYTSLIAFMAEWDDIRKSKNSTMRQLSDRPTGKHILYDNTTMDSSWIETENGDVAANFNTHKRIVNNVTLALPHAGVYAAATDPINGILQPSELLDIGEYSIRASVVSPVINVLCVNMNEDELKPLVYTQWPNARIEQTGFPDQWIGVADWQQDVPNSPTEWLNRTVVDDIFKWGEKYGRRPPAFQLYPIDFNMVTYHAINFTDPLYILAKGAIEDYTVCELRSWVTPKCSTTFNLSGTSGGHMEARCEDPNDQNAFERVSPEGTNLAPMPSGDWLNMANEWQLAIDLNGGAQNSNASNARVLTNLVIGKPELDPLLPSMAEGLAVLATSTLVTGSINTTFQPQWTHYEEVDDNNIIPNGIYETFRAEVQTQQYASAHTAAWQVIFYPVLALVFVLNVLCLLYLVFGTTFTSFLAAKPLLKKKKQDSSAVSAALPFPISFTRNKPRHQAQSSRGSDSENLVDDANAAARGEEGERGGVDSGKAAKGLVTDYTEPQNLFALAINSASSRALAGSCGHGPNATEMRVSWRVGYAASTNHYFFEEGTTAASEKDNAAAAPTAMSSGADLLDTPDEDGRYAKSYKRLSSRRAWL